MRLISGLLAALAMPWPAVAEQTRAPAPAVKVEPVVETVAKGLVFPWALQFLPDGRMLVTERPGRMRIVGKDGVLSAPVEGVPTVAAVGQGGMLDVALDPGFAGNRMIYFSYLEPRGGDSNGTTVARARLTADGRQPRLDNVEVLFRQRPNGSGGLNLGSRLAFARDGSLFVTLGDRFVTRDLAQDLGTDYGKVVRILPDGSVPKDNPFVGKANVLPEIWSYGHRNAQAAAIHPETGKLWIVEHGPKGGDEINVPLAGRNYGWPVIGYGVDYSGARIHESTHKDGMEQPIYYWVPSIAPSGMAFYTSDRIPAWKGNLFVGALAGQHLARLVLDGESIVAEERLLTGLGERIRDVRQGPDGALYVLTDNTHGRILRVTAK